MKSGGGLNEKLGVSNEKLSLSNEMIVFYKAETDHYALCSGPIFYKVCKA